MQYWSLSFGECGLSGPVEIDPPGLSRILVNGNELGVRRQGIQNGVTRRTGLKGRGMAG